MKTIHVTELHHICARALDAFGLELSAMRFANGKSHLELLKHDEQSMVIKAFCGVGSVEEIFVIKYVVESEFYGSEVTSHIQKLLGGDAGGRLTASGQFLFRELLANGPYVVWSVNSFVPNAPAFDWLDAYPRWHETHADSAGELLSHIHQKGEELTSTFVGADFQSMRSASANVVDWLSASIEVWLSNAETSSLVQSEVRQLVLKKVGAAVSNTKNGPHGGWLNHVKIMIHGDYQPGNILFKGDQAICAIDWDFAHMGDALLDVAYGLIMFCAIAPTGAELFDVRMADAFLQGYRRGYEHRAPLPYGLSWDSFFDCQNIRNGPLNLYLKIAAGLILLWSLSRQGLQHERGTLVREVAVRLILADHYA